jgi:hypothetical protein
MKRLILKAMDLGVTAAFLTLCAKVVCIHFYKDFERELLRQSRA